jgi:hypothetical protein
MSNNTIKTRIQNKHDTAANWHKATKFVPYLGEPIVFEPVLGEVFNNLPFSPTSRLKIGDGKTLVNNLPFVNAQNVVHIEANESIVVHPEMHNIVYHADSKDTGGALNVKIYLHPDDIQNTLENDYVTTKILAGTYRSSPLKVNVQCIVKDQNQDVKPVITPADCLLNTWCTDNVIGSGTSTVTDFTYKKAENGNPAMWTSSYTVSLPNDKKDNEDNDYVYSEGLVQIDIQLLKLDGSYWVTFDNKINLVQPTSN